MKDIPCKENKCISYPICLCKTEITCQELLDYFEDMHDRLLDKDDHDTTEYTWDQVCHEMHKQFKYLSTVRGTSPYVPGYRIVPEDIRKGKPSINPLFELKNHDPSL